MNEIIYSQFDDLTIEFSENGYINASKTAELFGKSLQTFICEIGNTLAFNRTNELIIESAESIWLHPKLAGEFTFWLGAGREFARWIEKEIERILCKLEFLQPLDVDDAPPNAYRTKLRKLVESDAIAEMHYLRLKRAERRLQELVNSCRSLQCKISDEKARVIDALAANLINNEIAFSEFPQAPIPDDISLENLNSLQESYVEMEEKLLETLNQHTDELCLLVR